MKGHIADIKYNEKTTVSARLHNTMPLQINFRNSKAIYPSRLSVNL